MKEIIEEIKERFKKGDILTRLIYINVSVYALFILIRLISGLSSSGDQSLWLVNLVYKITALNTDFFSFIIKPWTLITHQFVHSLSPWHILGNMIMLYFLGKLFLMYFNAKQLLGLYFLGGLIGAGALLIIANISPYFTAPVSAIGASAAVMAISIATCAFAPNQQVFLFGMFRVPLKWIGVGLVVSDLIFFFDNNTGGHIAHLGGAFTGLWFASSMKQGKDITKTINGIIDKLVNRFTKKSNLTVEYRNKAKDLNDEEYNYYKAATQEQIDEILDKINSSGYDSLSKQEKEILFKYSKHK
jgi:membrane associated rhomboid family serine protease